MSRPSIVIGLLVLILVGCRQDPAMHLGLGAARQATPSSATAIDTDVVVLIPANKKILSDKVLTAIALERVTGRKPDPRRFIEVR